MKKLYKLVIFSYLGPFIMTFFIALFILLMQFIWKYIDDFVGKGLEWYIIAKVLIFASASLVPLALPLSILLSSIMTFGNMAESYELVACKAAGISLRKVMAPLVVISLMISGLAFYFSNNLLPLANLKMGSLLYDIRQQRPALTIRPGAFNNTIENYSIRVESKDENKNILYGIMIYDHSDGLGNLKVTTAEWGTMNMSKDNHYLMVDLHNGYYYEEKNSIKGGRPDTHPLLRNEFNRNIIRFDLSSYKFNRTNEDLFKENFKMLNITQLQSATDTLTKNLEKRKKDYHISLKPYFHFTRDSNKTALIPPPYLKNPSYIMNFDKKDRQRIVDGALGQARNLKSFVTSMKEELDLSVKTIRKSEIEWHLKFTLSFACLILFFVGAPLGAIIKKGGLGLPVIVSTIFFVLFHILTIMGQKFAVEGVMPVSQGMWLASGVILPIGIFLTMKATSDSALFDFDVYKSSFKKLLRIKK